MFMQVKNCTVKVIDDDKYENEEIFYLKLDQAQGSSDCEARIGDINSTQITITNTEDGRLCYILSDPHT